MFDRDPERGISKARRGSSVSLDEVIQRAPSNWYLEAQEARNPGLIEAVLQGQAGGTFHACDCGRGVAVA
jgi:hypothetical protein